jgi:hypothetical protein
MSLPPRYAIAKKGQVDKYSKIFGLFGNLAIRVCQGPSMYTRTFKHGDPGYEVEREGRGWLKVKGSPLGPTVKASCLAPH